MFNQLGDWLLKRIRDWQVLLVLLLGALGASLLSYLLRATDTSWWEGFARNLSAELYGALITFLLLDGLVSGRRRLAARRRQQEREDEAAAFQERIAQELQRQLRGYVQGQTLSRLRATSTLEERELILNEMITNDLLHGAELFRGNLRGAELLGVNMEGANLQEADLLGVVMVGANLQRANLTHASMEEANLLGARLQGANLRSASLEGADLKGANLSGANLSRAFLEGADLSKASLERAELVGAKFDMLTRLPDGTAWTPTADLDRFTNPKHPRFWKQDDLETPTTLPKRKPGSKGD
jgi:uncharacterized protein YjbI with pentapeptide repeats